MFLEAVYMFASHISISFKTTVFFIIGYGVPFIIVLISVIIDNMFLNNKGYGTEVHCWISSYKNFNLSFIIPVSLVLAANIAIFSLDIHFLIDKMIKWQKNLRSNQKQEDSIRMLLINVRISIVLFGLPWLIGYFIIDSENTIAFSYMFTIINSSQGTLIFLIRCILPNKVRMLILQYLCCKKHDSKFERSSSKKPSTSTKSFTLTKSNSTYSSNTIGVDRQVKLTSVTENLYTTYITVRPKMHFSEN